MDKEDILLKQYGALNLESIIGFSKFNEYAVTYHSTAIEGSTLTQIEANLLLDEGGSHQKESRYFIHSWLPTIIRPFYLYWMKQRKINPSQLI